MDGNDVSTPRCAAVDNLCRTSAVAGTVTGMTDQPGDLDVRRPFTRADAVAAGIDPRLLRGKRFRRIFKGVYISAEAAPSPLHRVEAAVILHPPGAFASHVSAARVYDVPVPHFADEHVTVFSEKDRRRRAGIRCHVAPRTARTGRFKGIRVSLPIPMFIELASILSLVDLVVVGDALVRRRAFTPEQLVRACRESRDRHARSALRAASLVRDGVDSPMETRLRLLLVLAGLPEPEVNHLVVDAHGRVVRRFDLSYPEHKLIVEYDGRQHAEDPDQYTSDIYRREQLDDWGWRIVVVTAKGIFRRPEETLQRVRDALRARGAAGIPHQLDDGWRHHFPVQQPVRRSA